MSDILQKLQQATEGLLFSSESEYPIIALEWPADAPPPATSAALLATRGYRTGTPVQTLDFEKFFAFKTQQRDDQDDLQRETARRLGVLVEVLRLGLSDLRVYQVGNLNFDIFALGHDAQGHWFGVSTQMVQT